MNFLLYEFQLATETTPSMSLVDAMSEEVTRLTLAAFASTRGLTYAQLSDDQKYAIAIVAGCPMSPRDMRHNDNTMTFSTVPCKIEDDGNDGWIVGWQDEYGHLVVNWVRLREEDSDATL